MKGTSVRRHNVTSILLLLLLLSVIVTFTLPGCQKTTEGEKASSKKTLDPPAVKSVLSPTSSSFSMIDSIYLPKGFALRAVQESPPGDWDRRHGAITTIAWDLYGPDSGDVIFYVIFPSVGDAKDAWDGGKAHLATGFHVRSSGTLNYIKDPNRLFNGKLIESGKSNSGFSDAQALLANIIIRTSTITDRINNGANAAGAAALLESAITYLTGRMNITDY